MNAPDKIPTSQEPHVMKTYGRLPLALSHGRVFKGNFTSERCR